MAGRKGLEVCTSCAATGKLILTRISRSLSTYLCEPCLKKLHKKDWENYVLGEIDDESSQPRWKNLPGD